MALTLVSCKPADDSTGIAASAFRSRGESRALGVSGTDPYAEHVRVLREGRAKGLHVVLEKPFVVIGDGSSSEVETKAKHVVRWAMNGFKRDFFARDPERILDIWLLKGKVSYRTYSVALTGKAPTTPYGFYSAKHNALIMNIATGGGTLVHELVHPYIEANFPACPAWFNEGLGSLFEQTEDRDGHIAGLPNWRLPGLQDQIQAAKLPSFTALISTTTEQFYEDAAGSNYAQARYLLYYLQERNLLVTYYRQFVENQSTDPTGIATLKRVLQEPDLEAFQRRWEKWVLGLRFPE
jgi:hypothetical protein